VEKMRRLGAVPIGIPTATPSTQPAPPPAAQPASQPEKEEDLDAIVEGPTVSEGEILSRLDALNEMVGAKIDELLSHADADLGPEEVVAEVQALAVEIDAKERRLREQQQVLDDLARSSNAARLRAQLDAAEGEVSSLRALLRGSRDLRRENDELRAENARLKGSQLAALEAENAGLKAQIAQSEAEKEKAVGKKAKEYIASFVSAAIAEITPQTDMDTVSMMYQAFQKCTDQLYSEIDHAGQ